MLLLTTPFASGCKALQQQWHHLYPVNETSARVIQEEMCLCELEQLFVWNMLSDDLD